MPDRKSHETVAGQTDSGQGALDRSLDSRYRNTFGRDVHFLTRDLERALMRENAALGYQGLKLHWDSVFLNLDFRDGSRLVDLAQINGLTKQAMSQVVADIESHGYLTKLDDPSDGRARKIVLTDKGRKMVRDSIEAQSRVLQRYETVLGKDRLGQLRELLAELVHGLENMQ